MYDFVFNFQKHKTLTTIGVFGIGYCCYSITSYVGTAVDSVAFRSLDLISGAHYTIISAFVIPSATDWNFRYILVYWWLTEIFMPLNYGFWLIVFEGGGDCLRTMLGTKH